LKSLEISEVLDVRRTALRVKLESVVEPPLLCIPEWRSGSLAGDVVAQFFDALISQARA
jgi:hypothetical protein